jgi:hypothetical protein
MIRCRAMLLSTISPERMNAQKSAASTSST